MSLQLHIYHHRQLCHSSELVDCLQIGRQKPGEQPPIHIDVTGRRLVVAPVNDQLVSREHLELNVVDALTRSGDAANASDAAKIEVRNLSRKRSVLIDIHGRLGPQETICLPIPLLISFESFAIRIESAAQRLWEIHSLENPTLAPGAASTDQLTRLTQRAILNASANATLDRESLLRWLGEMMGVLQSAAATSDFLEQAVDAVDRIVGLDSIVALRLVDGEWRIEAAKDEQDFDNMGSDSRAPSRTILKRLRETKRTVYQVPTIANAAASLQGVKALVAAPILDPSGEVIGALYGTRFSRQAEQIPQISELEASMVEVITCSAAAGIAREQQQQKALQARIQFEQFFTPQLARELELNPNLLDGQELEITVLFCDIIGFSAVSQHLGPRRTMNWIGAVMDEISEVVLAHDGVIVDYIGDELMAMWGAPKAQHNHALLACLAARMMVQRKSAIDQAWQARTGRPTDFRVGICSGPASVGNTGSSRRLKYGPLGNTVNLASRMQSAAKQLGVTHLVSQTTCSTIPPDSALLFRPLGTARFVNIESVVRVCELGPADDADYRELATSYPAVIQSIERSQFTSALAQLEAIGKRYPNDRTTQALSDRLRSGAVQADCVWHCEFK
ncbi:MAG: adenylate/guanylate cyclase domain-containing protein [Planctomycetales bacterium]|nr:adenylate/guanylate cyclase domain-containing protein [Planctomycetales bacterium]